MINILQIWEKAGIKQTKKHVHVETGIKDSHFHGNKLKELFSTLFFNFAILFFIIGFGFTDTPTPFGWYQQFMPNLNGRQIVDITFTDSLTGYAITNYLNDTSFILKTTNSGDSWFYSHNDTGIANYYRIQFINQNTGFVGGYIDRNYFAKTTNAGLNWFYINSAYDQIALDMSVINENTIWFADGGSLTGGVFHTTNGGISWDHQINLGSANPDHIYMYNQRIGFISRTSQTQLRKTTDGGQTWNLVTGTGTGSFNDIYFTDSLTGWKCKTPGGGGWLMGKTTDGGFNWIEETLPHGGYIAGSGGIVHFKNINKDTIWGCGAYLYYPLNRAILDITTNGGDTWYLQIPDTSYRIQVLNFINFVDSKKGWGYVGDSRGIHTITGGDTVYYTGIVKKNKIIPKEFILNQNYPNPFNPRTVISYSLKLPGYIKLIAYDILGNEVQRMVDEKQQAGEYEVDFIGKFSSSGVYFYSLFVNGVLIDTKKMILLK